jgi:hypothetical protein
MHIFEVKKKFNDIAISKFINEIEQKKVVTKNRYIDSKL